MGRKRRKQDRQLPPYVYRKGENWIYRPYLGREDGKTLRGATVYLCPIDAPMSVLFAAYEKAIGESRGTVRWLLKQYHASPKFRQLGARTQRDYEDYRARICSRKGRAGKEFGDVDLAQVTQRTIRRYLDTYPAPIAANRHIQYLKAAWNWAVQRLDGVPPNPCIGVELNRQTARERYVSQDEYRAFMATTTGYLPLFMELAYLCRARWSEVAAMTTEDVLEEGLRVRRGKGSRGEITAWTPRLRAAVGACKAYNADAPRPITGAFLIHNRRGQPIRQNAFQTAWGRAMRAWVASGGERFTYHDLKAAGYSDQQEQYAGHRSGRMHDVYDRKLRVVRPAD
jgi:integrase